MCAFKKKDIWSGDQDGDGGRDMSNQMELY